MVNQPNTEIIHQILSKKNWRHRLRLTNELVTPGYCDESEWQIAQLPESLAGKSFLDVASNDGMYSILAEKRGASHVLGVDIYADKTNGLNMTNGWDLEKPNLLKTYFQSNARFESLSVYELNTLNQKFDYVFCSNLLAWLTDPYQALVALSDACSEVLHLREDVSWKGNSPVLEWVHTKPGSCFYNPNQAYFETVLKQLGFKRIEFSLIDERTLLKDRIARQILVKVKKDTPVFVNPFSSHIVSSMQEDPWYLSYSTYNDFYFIEALGWVKKEDVVATQPLLLGRSYPYLTMLNKLLSNKLHLEKNYVIKAYR